MQITISDFSREMQAYVSGLFEKRYGHAVALQLAATASPDGDAEYCGPLVV